MNSFTIRSLSDYVFLLILFTEFCNLTKCMEIKNITDTFSIDNFCTFLHKADFVSVHGLNEGRVRTNSQKNSFKMYARKSLNIEFMENFY